MNVPVALDSVLVQMPWVYDFSRVIPKFALDGIDPKESAWCTIEASFYETKHKREKGMTLLGAKVENLPVWARPKDFYGSYVRAMPDWEFLVNDKIPKPGTGFLHGVQHYLSLLGDPHHPLILCLLGQIFDPLLFIFFASLHQRRAHIEQQFYVYSYIYILRETRRSAGSRVFRVADVITLVAMAAASCEDPSDGTETDGQPLKWKKETKHVSFAAVAERAAACLCEDIERELKPGTEEKKGPSMIEGEKVTGPLR
eukprot:g36835.t1